LARLRIKQNVVKLHQKRINFWKSKFLQKKQTLTTFQQLRASRAQRNAKGIRELLSTRFTAQQIRLITNQKTKTHWSEEDISKSLCLRSKSISAHELVRNSWKIPLPSASTLKRWVTQIHFAPGLLHCVMNMLKVEFEAADQFDR
jgi:hypothetical protein